MSMMSINMIGARVRNVLLFLLPVLSLAVFLMIVFGDFVREAIALPLLHFLGFVRFFLDTIPQPFFWASFITLALLVAARSLVRGKKFRRRARGVEWSDPGRVEVWARRIYMVDAGGYSRWRLAHHLGNLALQILAHHERVEPWQVRQRLASSSGELDAPSEVLAYVRDGLRPVPLTPVGFFPRFMRRWRLSAPTPPLDLDPESVVQFLEHQLEVQHDHGDR